MLATKFKPEESIVVETPASTSASRLTKVFYRSPLMPKDACSSTVDNLNAKRTSSIRSIPEKNLNLNTAEKEAFVTGSSVGVPFAQLKGYYAMPPDQRTKFDRAQAPGVPTDTTASFESNELA